jgi:hypothetical protein
VHLWQQSCFAADSHHSLTLPSKLPCYPPAPARACDQRSMFTIAERSGSAGDHLVRSPCRACRVLLKLTTHRTLVTDNRTPPCAASGAGPAYTHAHMSAPHPGIPVGNSLAPHAAPMHHAPAQTYHQAAPHYPGAHTWHYNAYPDAITEQGLYAKGVTPYGLHS